jgi:hypothetical protein
VDKLERTYLVVALVSLSITAISWIGPEYHALLAVLDTAVGVLIGMVVFLPNRKGT